MKKLSKVVLVIIASLMSVAIVYLSVGSPDIDIERIALTYNNLSTKQAFYQYTKEDWIDYVEYVRKEQEEVEEKVPTPTKNNYASYGTHNHIAWRQNDFPNLYINAKGNYSLKTGGCGFCSCVSMMAELNPTVCFNMGPEEWVNLFKAKSHNEVFNFWEPGSGAMPGFQTAWIKAVNDIGGYGTYKMVESKSTSGTDVSAAAMEAIKEYAYKPEFIVLMSTGISSYKDCVFTDGGHIICVTDAFEENGEWYFHVDDSSARAAGRVKQNWDDMKNYNWKLDANADYNGYKYRIKGYWVIMRES